MNHSVIDVLIYIFEHYADDDADILAARVLAEEHRVFPLAVRLIAEGRVRIEADRVVIDGARGPANALINPEAA